MSILALNTIGKSVGIGIGVDNLAAANKSPTSSYHPIVVTYGVSDELTEPLGSNPKNSGMIVSSLIDCEYDCETSSIV
jgi:hypothetical protein